jgi:hypothetical protein
VQHLNTKETIGEAEMGQGAAKIHDDSNFLWAALKSFFDSKQHSTKK